MAFYQFKLNLIVSASTKAEAQARAENAYDNLCEMIGYSPFSCTLELDESPGEELDLSQDEIEDLLG